MRLFRIFIVGCALIFAAIPLAILPATPVHAASCAFPGFGGDRGAVIKACTILLQQSDLSDKYRAELLETRGRTFHLANNFNAAIKDFEEAIKLAPNEPRLRVRRGWVALDKREFVNAIELARQALSLDANSAAAYALIGAIGGRANDLGMAKAGYDKAIELNPDDVITRYNRFLLFKKIHAHEPALMELETLLQGQFPELGTRFATKENREMSYRTIVRMERVDLLEQMGRIDAAEKAASEWVEAEPGPVSLSRRGFLYFRQSDFEKAQADVDKAMSYNDSFWLLDNLQAHIFLYTKRYEPAVESFDRAIAGFPQNGKNYWGRAIALRALKRFDDATNDGLKAVDTDGDFARQIVGMLTKLGYFKINASETDWMPAERDAVRACMLDERCW